MSDRYDEILANPAAFFNAVNPTTNVANCPETADAVHDYLVTGQRRQVRGDLFSRFRFSRRTRFRPAASLARLLLLVPRHGTHIVVRMSTGSRNQPQNTHYFILAHIRSRVYIVDAYTREVNQNINEYLHRQPFNNLDYATNYDIIVEQSDLGIDTTP